MIIVKRFIKGLGKVYTGFVWLRIGARVRLL
jgi:hypothetical protein